MGGGGIVRFLELGLGLLYVELLVFFVEVFCILIDLFFFGDLEIRKLCSLVFVFWDLDFIVMIFWCFFFCVWFFYVFKLKVSCIYFIVCFMVMNGFCNLGRKL